jgi:hypothetical protein
MSLAIPRPGGRPLSTSVRALALAFAAMLFLATGTASGNAVRVTRGDAQAVCEAFGNGGWTILQHSHVIVQGAPADGLVGGLVVIRPISSIFDGKHYCALDWHVILVAEFDGGDASYTIQDFEAFRAATSIAFTLDGQPLATVRTATKPFQRDLSSIGVTAAYYFQQGSVMSPDALAIGAHTPGLAESDPYGSGTDNLTFYIDAPNTGVCL